MLNRRLLRIKVMQGLYSLNQCKIANYNNALAYMDEAFAPDLLADEKQDLKMLQSKKNKALVCLENYFQTKSKECQEEEDIRRAVNESIVDYHNQVEKDKKHFGKILDEEMDGIYENYLMILSFLVELADYALIDNEDEKKKLLKQGMLEIPEMKITQNKVIGFIRDNKDFISNTAKGKLVWDIDLVRKIFRQNLRSDAVFKEYLTNKESGVKEDRDVLLHIVKEIIFKDQFLQVYFEEKDIKWQENKAIVKSMSTKTLKAVEEDAKDIKLMSISANWEEDKSFYQELYKATVLKFEELEQSVSEKIENWDIERLATLDRIILILAISEMIAFPSIPVKVSINEYIELSKLYSTPKSKQFINGILDKLAEDLTHKGLIRKSGRGLIDNK